MSTIFRLNKELILAILLLISTCILVPLKAQYGPGGIEQTNGGSALELWLSADSITGLSNGDSISNWPDRSGNGRHATQTGINRPTHQQSQLNNLPVVRFDGADDHFENTADATYSYNARTAFIVYNLKQSLQGTDDLGQMWGDYNAGVHVAIDTRSGNLDGLSFDGSGGGGTAQGSYSFNGEMPGPFISNNNSNPVRRDTFDIMFVEFQTTESVNDQYIGSLLPNFSISEHNFGGEIAEIIIFSRVLNVVERGAVQNYLSSKYDIAIGIVDKYAFEATHNVDLAGIGRINPSNQLTTNFSYPLELSSFSGTSLDDMDFLYAAHQNGTLSWSTSELPSAGLGNIQRISREWRLDETGTLDSIRISLDTGALSARPTGYSKFVLLVDDDGDFTDAKVFEMFSRNGDHIYEKDIAVTDGVYISFGCVRPVIGFPQSNINDLELNNASLSINLNYIPLSDVIFNYSTADGSAQDENGTNDYMSLSVTDTIHAVDSIETISFQISITNDSDLETSESFSVSISGQPVDVNLLNSPLTYTIEDDDNPRKIYFNNDSSSVNEFGDSIGIQVDITSLFVDNSNPTTVKYIITGGTATGGGVDYSTSQDTGTIVVPASFVSGTFYVQIEDDALNEVDETFIIELIEPTNSSLSASNPIQHVVTILDNEAEPVISFSQTSSSGSEDSSPEIQVSLSALAGTSVSANFTVSGTATSGDDFLLTNGIVNIDAGDLDSIISIPITDDAETESLETVVLTLSSVTNGVLGTDSIHTYTIIDNDGEFGFSGPAGVGGPSVNTLWLKADSITGLSDGAAISGNWRDVSGNNHHASQTTASYQPTFEVNEFNNYPTVRLDGTDDFFDDTYAYNARTVLGVVRMSSINQSTSQLAQLWGYYGDGFHVALDPRSGANLRGFSFDGNSSSQAKYGINGAAFGSLVANDNTSQWTYDVPQIYAAEFSQSKSASRQVIGSLFDEFPVGTHQLAGDIGEIIVYSIVLNSARRNIVENYLGHKYGISISNDLFAPSDANYSHDLAGIGQESDGGHDDAQSNNILRILSPSDLGNGEYLLFAHDSSSLSWSATEIPSGADSLQRIGREWAVDETGNIGTVTLRLDTTYLVSRPSDYQGYILLVDDDGDFSNGGTSAHRMIQNGTYYEVTGLDVSDSYFTFATAGIAVSFALSSSSATEAGTNVDLEVNLSRASTVGAMNIDFAIQGTSTALAGNDYTLNTASPLTIAQGNTTANINFTITNESIPELEETIIVHLTDASGNGFISADSIHTYTILDDDALVGGINGPGGVRAANDYVFWLASDTGVYENTAGSELAEDMDPVFYWTDLSGNSNNADTSILSTGLPVYENNTSSNRNQKPILDFSAGDYGLTIQDASLINSGGPYTEKTVVAAFKTGSNITNRQVIFEQGGGSNGLNIHVESGQVKVALWDDNFTSTYHEYSTAASINTTYLCAIEFDGASQTLRGFINGQLAGSTTSIGQPDFDGHGGDIGIGWMKNDSYFTSGIQAGEGNYFTGEIYELIETNTNFNEAERRIVENYLAAKYDINISSGNDYYSAKTTHSFGVIGVGQDSSEFHLASLSDSLLSISNLTTLSNGDFVIIGHDNGAINSYNSTESPSSDILRLEREWRMDVTGTPGSAKFVVDTSEIPVSFTMDHDFFVMLVDEDTNFSTGATIHNMILSNGNFELSMDISSDRYFTFGVLKPEVSFTSSSANNTEDAGNQQIEVSINIPIDTAVRIPFRVLGSSSASFGSDHNLTADTVIIPANSNAVNITLPLLTDGVPESDETVVLDIDHPSAPNSRFVDLGSDSTFTFFINDIDQSSAIEFAAQNSQVSENAVLTNLTIKLSQVNPSDTTKVYYLVSGGTATNGPDFVLMADTLRIPPNTISSSISLSITDDMNDEDDETVIVTIQGPVNAKLGSNKTHILTIQDNDSEPTVNFLSSSSSGSESTSPANIIAVLSASSGKTITVDYATSAVTANAGIDFTSTSGILTFLPGDSVETISVPVVDNIAIEVDETFNTTLSNSGNLSNVVLGSTLVNTYTILDDDNAGFNGPGGVRNPSDFLFWLRSDKSVLGQSGPITNNTEVDSIIDYSTNARGAGGVIGSTAPVYFDNVLNNVNGKPILQFGNGQHMVIPNDNAINISGPYGVRTIIAAFQAGDDNNLAQEQVIYEQGGGTNGMAIYIDNDSVFVSIWCESCSPAYTFTKTGKPISPNQTIVAILEFNGTDSLLSGYINGDSLPSRSLSVPEIATHGGEISFGASSDSWELGGIDGFEGKIMEITSYSGLLNKSQRILIENYLAGKYNAPISGTGLDLFNYETQHSFGISGIGRVSASDFHSKAESDSLLTISNASDLGDGEYIIFGHDNADASSFVTTEAPSGIQRIAREYRLTVTGNPGTVNIEIDTTQISGNPSTGYTEFVLMADSDGDFSSGSSIVSLTNNSGVLSASNVSLADGNYLTVGVVRPVVSFQSNIGNGPENSSPAQARVELNHPIGSDITFTISQTGGTSTESNDYTFSDGQHTISAGQTFVDIPIAIIDDSQVESDETIILTASNPNIGFIEGNTSFTYTINDDDNFRKFNLVKSDSTNSESGSPITVDVFLNVSNSISSTQVYYSVTSGTASNDSIDFFLTSPDTLTFAIGDTLETISINIIDDNIDEDDETIVITLTGGNGATIGDTTIFTYTIQDNDVAPVVKFSSLTKSGSETFQTVDLAVELSNISGKTITLPFSATGTGGAPAESGDFNLTTNSLTITPGKLTDSIQFTVVDDFFNENNEQILVTLESGGLQNATLDNDSISLIYTILDNDGNGIDGPGGVGTLNTQVTSWLNAEQTDLSNGSSVALWDDLSSNNNDGKQTTPNAQPLFLTNAWNGRPVLAFDGSSDFLQIDNTDDINTGGPYDRKTIVVAFRTSTDVTTRQMIYEEGGGIRGLSVYIDNGLLYMGGWNNNDDDAGATTPWPQPGPPTNYTISTTNAVSTNSNNFLYLQFDFSAGVGITGNVSASLNGADLSPITGAGRLFAHGGNIGIGAKNNGTVYHDGVSNNNGEYFNGFIGEVVINNLVYNTAQRKIVNNYLAAKYNIAISNDLYEYQATHNYEVFGIGQDSITASHAQAKGTGFVTISNPSDLDNTEFLLIGNDNGSITNWSSSDLPNDNTVTFRRLSREWRIDYTNQGSGDGSIGTVTFELATSSFPAPPAGFNNNFVLILDNDGDYSSGSRVYQLNDQGGGVYDITNLTFEDGDYFTIGLAKQIIRLTSDASSVAENSGTATINVGLPYFTVSSATVDYSVTGGTASGSGTDYTLADGTATISAGSRVGSINIPLVDDALIETDETVILEISNPSTGNTLGTATTHTMTIQDDDNVRKVQFLVTADTANETSSPVQVQVFVDSLAQSDSIRVYYSVTGGTAISGSDYSPIAGDTLKFPSYDDDPTDTIRSFNITILTDALDENDETIVLTLSSPTGANLGTNDTYIFLLQDDPATVSPTVSFSRTEVFGSEDITSASLELSLSEPSSKQITVNYSVNADTTTATGGGIDYTLTTSSVIIPAGDTTANINFSIFNDNIIESDEVLAIQITSAINASLASSDTIAKYHIIDEDGGLGSIGLGGVGNRQNGDLMAFWFSTGDTTTIFSDSGSTVVTNGSDVRQWVDRLGNGRNASDPTATTNVTDSVPSFATNLLNGHPGVLFNASNNEFLQVVSDPTINTVVGVYTKKAYGIVFRTGADVTTRQVIYDQGGSGNGLNIYLEGGSVRFGAWSANQSWSGTQVEITSAVSTNTAYQLFVEYDQSAPEIRGWLNGTSMGTATTNNMGNGLNSHGGLNGLGGMYNGSYFHDGAASGEGNHYTGDIFEFFHFNETNSNSAQRKIQGSAIAAKYGISFAGDIYNEDLTHPHDVLGIGQDSTNARHIIAQANGMQLDQPSGLSDGGFLLIGHDNGNIDTFSGTGISPELAPYINKVARTWKVDRVGSLSSLQISFDTTMLPTLPADKQEYLLIVDGDDDGDFTDTVEYYLLNEYFGNFVRKSGITLVDGDLFTIGVGRNVAINKGPWNDPNTWLVGVPAANEDVVLNDSVTLDQDREITNMTVPSGGYLDLAGLKLNISGDFDMNGTFVANNGTVEYSSASDTVCVEPLAYHHLIISGGGRKILCGNITIDGDLTINNNPEFNTDGTNDYSITIRGNWQTAVSSTFTDNSSTVTFDGSSGNQTVEKTSGTESFYNMVVNKSVGDVVLNGPLTVQNQLTLTQSNVSLGDNDLLVDNTSGSAISSPGDNTAYIKAIGNGFLRRSISTSTSYLFPIGDNSNYTPLTFTLNSGTTASPVIQVNIDTTIHPNMNPSGVYINRYWTFEGSGITSPNYDVSYTYLDSDVSDPAFESTMKAVKYSGTSKVVGGFVNASTNTFTLSGMTTFSEGSGGDNTGLPVELLFINVKANENNNAIIEWATASETNSDYFEIQKSVNGIDFEFLDLMNGQGTVARRNDYQVVDRNPVNGGTTYYRIRQVDLDGSYTYTKVVQLYLPPAIDFNVNLFPVPNDGRELRVRITGMDNDESFALNIIDISGRTVGYKKVSAGDLEFENNILVQFAHTLPSGIYQMLIQSDRRSFIQKIIVK